MLNGTKKCCHEIKSDFFTNFGGPPYGVIILNSEILLNANFFCTLWNNADIRVLVDGGADQWLKVVNNLNNTIVTPHLVTGDFDSIKPESLLSFTKNKLVKVIRTPNQDETDFTKALREFHKFQKTCDITVKTIYVITEYSSRLDHIMGNLNTLCKAPKIFQYPLKICLLSSCVSSISLTWYIEPKIRHEIPIPQIFREKQSPCGLIPIGSAAYVTTSGLKWNLNNKKIEFGGLVSTSNTYDGSPMVTIETDSALLWTMSIEDLFL